MVAAASLVSSAAEKYSTVAKSTATKLTDATESLKVNQSSQGMMVSKLNQTAQGMVYLSSVNNHHIKYFHSDVDNLFAMSLDWFLLMIYLSKDNLQ